MLACTSAWCAESMKTAIDIVEDFSREANILMRSRSIAPVSEAARDHAIEELKQIRLTEPPGQDRSKRVYVVVSSYTGYVVDSVRRSGGKKEDVEEITGRLTGLEADMLKKLQTILSAESTAKKEPRPVPSLDLSPHDEPDEPPYDEKGGILYR